MFKADTLTDHIMQMFWKSKAKLFVMFRSVKKFRDMEEDGWGTQDSDLKDDEELDTKSVIDRVRLTVKSIRASPQKRIQFEETVRIAFPE
jgi:hypothetical protein